jgi:uncharacterized protein (TIGR03435 family)
MRYKPLVSAVLAAALIHEMPAAAQTFKVASVKPTPDDTPWYYRLNAGGRTVLRGYRLRDLILLAWQTENFRVIGTSGWMDSERFNIEAIGDPESDLDETRLMVRSLLADRFRLRLHRDTRESPVYALIPVKKGSQLQPSSGAGECVPYDGSASAPPADSTLPSCSFRSHMRHSDDGSQLMVIEAAAVGMTMITKVLGTLSGRHVVDETGLTGSFAFKLEYASGDDASGPSLFSAVQDQLGLKLESRKAPVEFFVVDSATHPSPN